MKKKYIIVLIIINLICVLLSTITYVNRQHTDYDIIEIEEDNGIIQINITELNNTITQREIGFKLKEEKDNE